MKLQKNKSCLRCRLLSFKNDAIFQLILAFVGSPVHQVPVTGEFDFLALEYFILFNNLFIFNEIPDCCRIKVAVRMLDVVNDPEQD